MDPYLVLVLVLLLFVLLVGGLSLLRREPLSYRYAGEILLLGAVLLAVLRALQLPSPVLFSVALYLVTMRSRLLVDLANSLARRGRLDVALRLYSVALRLAIDPTDRLIVWANRGAALLQGGELAEAIAVLQKVLAVPSALGIRLEAACRCNLGLAYLRRGQVGLGRAQLLEAIDTLPGSVYANRARLALQQLEAAPSNPT